MFQNTFTHYRLPMDQVGAGDDRLPPGRWRLPSEIPLAVILDD